MNNKTLLILNSIDGLRDFWGVKWLFFKVSVGFLNGFQTEVEK